MTSQNSRAPKYSNAPGVATRYDIAEFTAWLWASLGKIRKSINPSLKATHWRGSDLDAHVAQ